MDLKQITHADNVRLSDDGRAVRILDQSRLPNETVYLELSSPEELYEAIASLRVRGPRPSASLPGMPSTSWLSRAGKPSGPLCGRVPEAPGLSQRLPPTAVTSSTCWTGCWRWPSPCPAPTWPPSRTPWGRPPGPSTRRTSPCAPPSPSMACPW